MAVAMEKKNFVSYLTRRERQILSLLADGLSQKEIANRLYLSPNTISTHVQNLYLKMNVHTGTHAIAKAFRAKILT